MRKHNKKMRLSGKNKGIKADKLISKELKKLRPFIIYCSQNYFFEKKYFKKRSAKDDIFELWSKCEERCFPAADFLHPLPADLLKEWIKISAETAELLNKQFPEFLKIYEKTLNLFVSKPDLNFIPRAVNGCRVDFLAVCALRKQKLATRTDLQ